MLRCVVAIALASSLLIASVGCGGGGTGGPATPPAATINLPDKQAPAAAKGKNNPASLPAKAID